MQITERIMHVTAHWIDDTNYSVSQASHCPSSNTGSIKHQGRCFSMPLALSHFFLLRLSKMFIAACFMKRKPYVHFLIDINL